MEGKLLKRKCWVSHVYLYNKGVEIFTSENFPKESHWQAFPNELNAKDWQVWNGMEWKPVDLKMNPVSDEVVERVRKYIKENGIDVVHSSGEPKTDLNSD